MGRRCRDLGGVFGCWVFGFESVFEKLEAQKAAVKIRDCASANWKWNLNNDYQL